DDLDARRGQFLGELAGETQRRLVGRAGADQGDAPCAGEQLATHEEDGRWIVDALEQLGIRLTAKRDSPRAGRASRRDRPVAQVLEVGELREELARPAVQPPPRTLRKDRAGPRPQTPPSRAAGIRPA